MRLIKWDDFHSARYFFIKSSFPHIFFPRFMPKKIVGFLSAFIATDTTVAIAAAEDQEYFGSVQECNDSWLSSELTDECLICLRGRNGEIAEIDGGMADWNAIRYVYDNSNDSTWCEILEDHNVACAAGFYGFPWAADGDYELRGCDRCPGGGTSMAVAGQEKAITDCYIAANTAQKDTTGTYVYTNDCHYTK